MTSRLASLGVRVFALALCCLALGIRDPVRPSYAIGLIGHLDRMFLVQVGRFLVECRRLVVLARSMLV